MRTIRAAAYVFLQHPPSLSHSELSVSTSTSASTVTWPIVVAAQARRRIHISHHNTHLLDIAGESQALDHTHLSTRISTALQRLHGLPSARISVEILSPLAGSVLDTAFSPSTLPNNYFTLRMRPVNFVPGVDGRVCVSYRGEYLTCVTAPHFVFKFRLGRSPMRPILSPTSSTDTDMNINAVDAVDVDTMTCPAPSGELQSLELVFDVKGTAFSDEVYTTRLKVQYQDVEGGLVGDEAAWPVEPHMRGIQVVPVLLTLSVC